MMSEEPRTPVCWLICGDRKTGDRVRLSLQSLQLEWVVDCQMDLAEFRECVEEGELPTLILLEVGQRMKTSTRVLDALTKMRLKAPIIAITHDTSHEFAKNFLSRGIRFHVAHDFCPSEILEVVKSLLEWQKPRG